LTDEAQAKLDEFFRCFRGEARPLLLLDYDGTLAPFRVDRFRAQPWGGVRELLNQVQRQARTRVAVVTGRPAEEIFPLLGIEPRLEVWGLHGAERLRADGRREFEHLSPSVRAVLDALSAELKRDATGGLIEEKPNAVVMHWRGVGPLRAKAIEKRTRALFEPAARMNGLNLLEFEAGLELRAGRDKGGAVTAILEETQGPGRRPAAYLGDDLTDESAFRAMKGHGLGVLVRLRPRPTEADIWLHPPKDLRRFLKMWLHACTHLQSNLYDPLLHSR
jgi:trehalose 6-phosphate synthase/trehalose 6-phosphate phosphatase